MIRNILIIQLNINLEPLINRQLHLLRDSVKQLWVQCSHSITIGIIDQRVSKFIKIKLAKHIYDNQHRAFRGLFKWAIPSRRRAFRAIIAIQAKFCTPSGNGSREELDRYPNGRHRRTLERAVNTHEAPEDNAITRTDAAPRDSENKYNVGTRAISLQCLRALRYI